MGRNDDQIVLLQIWRELLGGEPSLSKFQESFKSRDYSVVKKLLQSLASSLEQRAFHPHFVTFLLSFFSFVIDKYSAFITTELSFLFRSVLLYWKSNLEDVLLFVKNCASLLPFSDAYSIILQQILFGFYDDHAFNTTEISMVTLSALSHSQVLLHLQQVAATLQLHLPLLLPALRFLLQRQTSFPPIQLLTLNLVKEIVFRVDVSSYVTLLVAWLDDLLFACPTFTEECVDLVCLLAAKINNASAASSKTVSIAISNRCYIVGDGQFQSNPPENGPISVDFLKEDECLLYASPNTAAESTPSVDSLAFLSNIQLATASARNVLLLSEESQNSYCLPPLNRKPSTNPPYQFPLFDAASPLPQSPSFQALLRLVNHTSAFLFSHHKQHVTLAVVKKAVCSFSPSHVQLFSYPTFISVHYTSHITEAMRSLRVLRQVSEPLLSPQPAFASPRTLDEANDDQDSVQLDVVLDSVTHHLQQCSELRSDVRIARRPHLVEGRHALERGPHRTDRRLRAPLADLRSHLLRQGSRSLQLLALRLHVRCLLVRARHVAARLLRQGAVPFRRDALAGERDAADDGDDRS